MKLSIHNLTLGQKLLSLPAIALLGLAALESTNARLTANVERSVLFPNFESVMNDDIKTTLRGLTEVEAVSLGRRLGHLNSRPDQMAAVVEETDPIRFFDDRSGYFFAYTLDGTRINVPTNKKDNGKNLIDLKDPNGVPFIRELAEAARAGGGFVSYAFEKPGKGVQPKLAFATVIPGTDFFIGTGVYIDNVEAARARLGAKIAAERSKYDWWIVAVFLVILAVSLGLTLAIARVVATSVRRTVKALMDGSDEITTASSQLSIQSQSLAQDASHQAMKIDATAEALRQISGMTAENTQNAAQAESSAKLAQAAADRGLTDARQMRESISAINASSADIVKIIKVIDEIAFQTNILALNAAVEAARAGEYGKGFAVVADEVRKLAQRSAQAARESTEKIESAVAKTSSGANVSLEVAGALDQVVGQVSEMVGRIGAVAQASTQQSRAVDEINGAVGVMSQLTQHTAASAEESAAAAEELNAQATCMKAAVSDLLRLVGGR